MNKTLTDKLFSSVREVFGNITKSAKKFSEDYDIASTPSFFIFMVVVTAGLTVNYYYLAPKVGNIEAAAISLMFEVGIFAWKLQGHRIRNSAAQAQIVNWATWISTGLAFAMLVSSLTERIAWGWIVAIAALVHVVAFLIFDQNDTVRNNRRDNQSAMESINQREIQANNAIKEAEADLKIIHKITAELTRLRKEYNHLPVNELEFVLETTRTRLLKEYKASAGVDNATKSQADVNGDGRIGNRQQVVSFAADVKDYTPEVERKPRNPQPGQERKD